LSARSFGADAARRSPGKRIGTSGSGTDQRRFQLADRWGGTLLIPSGGRWVFSSSERKQLTFCSQDRGVWQVVRMLIPVASSPHCAWWRWGQTGKTPWRSGLSGVAWLPLFGQVWRFLELDDYETPIRDGFLHDVVSGDLNNDGRKDLVFIETAKNYLDIVMFEPLTGWCRQPLAVFEGAASARVPGLAEPRGHLSPISPVTGGPTSSCSCTTGSLYPPG
jgi:hypothetical protein